MWPFRRSIRNLERTCNTRALVHALQCRPREAYEILDALVRIGDASTLSDIVRVARNLGAISQLSSAVLRTLGRMCGQLGIEALCGLLGDEDGWMRRNAEQALIEIGARSLSPVRSSLADPNRFRSASLVLGVLGDEEAVDEFLKVVCDESRNKYDRGDAIMALGEIGDARVVETLCAVLRKDRESYVRREAAKALGTIGNCSGVLALCAALEDENVNVAQDAAEALGVIGDSSSIAALSRALGTPDDFLRYRASHALKLIGPAAISALSNLLRDGTVAQRRESAKTLPNALSKRSVAQQRQQVLQALQFAARDPDSTVRLCAVEALGMIADRGDNSALEVLTMVLDDSYPMVQNEAEKAIRRVRDVPGPQELLERCSEFPTSESMELLARHHTPQVVAVLVAALQRTAFFDQSTAARLLGEIGDRSATPALVAQLGRGEDFLRESVARALGDMGDPDAVHALCETLRDKSAAVRAAAAHALGGIGSPAAAAALCGSLCDKDSQVRAQAASALGRIGGIQAVTALRETLVDSDLIVLAAARRALSRIRGKGPEVRPYAVRHAQ